ncbi:RNA 2'-phosphotransferase [uncultured Tenacibaculum sp.]|uniref:RNA 2'-phosphotransferase n=1 Tax=uncultured Tenacibaculum sp. TaxID=174713 RepID=UPI00260A032D|nr:RNA 2'-phosphotransferase [uncultured Tenacibaculum sp.]
MNEKEIKKISKFLSLLLRHKPEKIDLTLDKNGWAIVEELINKSKKAGTLFSKEDLELIVKTNDKQRFAFNEDKTKIRASQGHSIQDVEILTETQTPPPFLYHGTVAKFIAPIKETGLQKMNRQHVHLSLDKETAIKVASRRGKPVILTIRTDEMYKEGYKFYLSENGVWLTDNIPSHFIQF